MLKKIILFVSVFVLPPLILGTISAFETLSTTMLQKKPAALDAAVQLPSPPALTHKFKAAILMSTEGTQVTDLLAPFELLAASDAFDVYTVAKERTLSPTTAQLAVLPHYSFKDAPRPDLLVIPAILESGNSEMIRWIQDASRGAKLTLSVCEGARVATEAGLFHGKRGTSHFLALESLKQSDPTATWESNTRWVIDGALISTAGVTASLDGALVAIEKMAGKEASERARTKTGYPGNSIHATGADSGIQTLDLLEIFLRAGFDFFRERIAVLVYPGVSEIGLAAALDTFPRTEDYAVFTLAQKREPIRTAHGLDLVPAEGISDSIRAEWLWIPEGHEVQLSAETQDWAKRNAAVVKDSSALSSGGAYERALHTIAEFQGPRITRFVAKMIQDPRVPASAHQNALSKDWPFALWIRIVIIGALGVILAAWFERKIFGKKQK